jgi:hypothetical protein
MLFGKAFFVFWRFLANASKEVLAVALLPSILVFSHKPKWRDEYEKD